MRSARSHALVSIFGAFEIWDRLGIHVGTGGLTVSAGAHIVESGLPS